MIVGAQSAPWSLARLPPVDCYLIPGVIIKGGNIAPKAAHTATGHTFREMFNEWDWAGWIKPQIDALHSIGGNTVRIIGDIEGINDGTFTLATYLSRWAQLIDYAATLGMHTYPALSGVSQISGGGLNVTQISDSLVAVAEGLNARAANIIGLDLIQESVRRQVADSYALAFGSTFTPNVRAVTALPLTYSHSDANFDGVGRFAFPLWRDALRPWVDFWDVHTYSPAPRTLVHDAFFGMGETMPVLVGEFGSPASDGQAFQERHYDAAVALGNYRKGNLHAAGSIAWGIFDQGAGANAFGMFETNGTPRSHLTTRFQQLPT